MKVGTDGVLLGAWTGCENCITVLDVGTGTGLISLVIAQRNPGALLTALEIDPPSASQAGENIASSPWADRIALICCDFRTWEPPVNQQFDLVVCNPPFFNKSLKNPDNRKATARHDDDLPLSVLIEKSAGLLTSRGKLALILPAGRDAAALETASAKGLFLQRRTDVRGHAGAPVKRVLMEWGREYRSCETRDLVIETTARGVYSGDYKDLTREFYLK